MPNRRSPLNLAALAFMPPTLSRTAQPRACAGVCLVSITWGSGSLKVCGSVCATVWQVRVRASCLLLPRLVVHLIALLASLTLKSCTLTCAKDVAFKGA